MMKPLLAALHIIAILIAFDANYHSWNSSPHFEADGFGLT
jgi:hypothetical protein